MGTERKVGRPPAAVNEHGEPEETSRWDQFSFRVRPATKALLIAIRGLRPGVPLWRVMEDILHAHVQALPAQDRRLIKALVARQANKPRE